MTVHGKPVMDDQEAEKSGVALIGCVVSQCT